MTPYAAAGFSLVCASACLASLLLNAWFTRKLLRAADRLRDAIERRGDRP